MNGWENGTEGYVGSVKRLLTEPTAFFREIDTNSSINRAIIFALISWLIAGVGMAVWAVAGGSLQMIPQFAGERGTQGTLAAAGIGIALQVIIYLLMPLWGVMGAFVSGAITHLFLVLFGDGEKGYMTTVRANLYGTATGVIYLIPCCGGMIAGIWTLVLTIIGLTTMHQTSTGKVLAAIFAPMLLCCVCIAIIAGIAFAIGGAAVLSQFPQLRGY